MRLFFFALITTFATGAFASSQGEYFYYSSGGIEYEGYKLINDGNRSIRVWYESRTVYHTSNPYTGGYSQVYNETTYAEIAPGGSLDFATTERHYEPDPIAVIDRTYLWEEEFGSPVHTHTWVSEDAPRAWVYGTWSGWTTDATGHGRSRTNTRVHDTRSVCQCGAVQSSASYTETVVENDVGGHAWSHYDTAGSTTYGSWGSWIDNGGTHVRSRSTSTPHTAGDVCTACGYAKPASYTASGTDVQTGSHSWAGFDNPGSWSYGTWSTWSPSWDAAVHLTSEYCDQSRNRTNSRTHTTGSSCAVCSATSSGATYTEYDDDTHSRRVWGTMLVPTEPQPEPQSLVSVSPAHKAITVGDSVTLTASGGSGSGAFRWSGSAGGVGVSKSITFTATGTYTVSVYREASAGYMNSNAATASVTVTAAPMPVTFQIRARAVPRPGMSAWLRASEERLWTAPVQPVSP